MEEFKVGDWLYLLENYGELKKGSVYPFRKYQADDKKYTTVLHNDNYTRGYLSTPTKNLRLALPHEIPNNELIIEIW